MAIIVLGCSDDSPASTIADSTRSYQSIRVLFAEWMDSDQYQDITQVMEGIPISTVEDLQNIGLSSATLARTYYLTNHIDLSAISDWTPIGNALTPFTGTLYGNGYVVYGLTIRVSDNYRGLFGVIDNATITDLGIGVTFIKARSYVGGLAGKVVSTQSISNIAVTGMYADSDINFERYGGGIVGYVKAGTLYAYNYGLPITVEGAEYGGGLAGYVEDGVHITGINTVDVTAMSSNYVGGLVGRGGNARIVGVNTGSISGREGVGGLAGISGGTVTGVNTGKVTGRERAGGLVGNTSYDIPWNVSGINTGLITGLMFVGGLVGDANNITNNNNTLTGYNLGWVLATDVASAHIDVTVGNRVSSDRLKTYYSSSEYSEDKVGTIEGRGYIAPVNSTGVTISDVMDLPTGENEGEWTFVPGEWPKINLPKEITNVRDVEILNFETPPENFVDGKKITNITLSASAVTVRPFGTETVTATFEPEDAAPPLLWEYTPANLVEIKNEYIDNTLVLHITSTQESTSTTPTTITITLPYTTDAYPVTVNIGGPSYNRIFEWWITYPTTAPYRVSSNDGGKFINEGKPLGLSELRLIGNDANYPLNGIYYLVEDIDLIKEEDWTPLGSKDAPFTGTLHGNGFTINNLVVSGTGEYRGLFAALDGATIEHLGLRGRGVAGDSYLGILAGTSKNSTLTNIMVTGSVSQTQVDATSEASECFCGGLVGYAEGGTFTDVYAYLLQIDGKGDYAGGLIGLLNTQNTETTVIGTTINYDFSTNEFVVTEEGNSAIKRGYVQGREYVGGIIGGLNGSKAGIEAMNAFDVYGYSYVGGIVGAISSSQDTTMSVINTAPVTGALRVGGLIGNIGDTTSLLVNGYNTHNVEGFYYVGGLVGLENAGSTGEIRGYNLGWIMIGDTPLAGGPTIAKTNNAITHSVYFNIGDDTDDRVGSIDFYAEAPQTGNVVGVAIDGADNATEINMSALTAGNDVPWTFTSGAWPTVPLPSSITYVMDEMSFEITEPDKPFNFVD